MRPHNIAMLAAAAVLWLLADASVERLAVTPPGPQSGVVFHGGFEVTQPVSPSVTIALTARAGAAHVDDWRPVFDGAATLSWRELLDVHAGARHDDRLRRDGVLLGYRDPTGRLFAGVSVMPFHRNGIAAGAAFDYERAMPGPGRLPSGTRVTAVVRFRVRV
jgi:hypothetical protein